MEATCDRKSSTIVPYCYRYDYHYILLKEMVRYCPDAMIKIEPFPEPEYFYQPGDIVIGKCLNHFPWPGVIHSFYGYDEDEVQVYQVDFFQEKSYAFLETYLITPLSDHAIRRMRAKSYEDDAIRNAIMKALRQAECALRQLKLAITGDHKQEERFRRMYHPEVELDFYVLEDVESFPNRTQQRSNL